MDEQDHQMKCLPALGVFDSDLLNPFKQIPQRTPRSNPSIAPPEPQEGRGEKPKGDPAGPAPEALPRLEFRVKLSYSSLIEIEWRQGRPSFPATKPPSPWLPARTPQDCLSATQGRRPSLLPELTPGATLAAASSAVSILSSL